MNYLGGAMAALLLLSGCARAPIGPTQHESVHFDLDSSEVLRLNLKMGAGELHVNGGSKYLADADFSHNIASWKPLVSYHSTGSRGDLDITDARAVRDAVAGADVVVPHRFDDGADVALDVHRQVVPIFSKIRRPGTLALSIAMSVLPTCVWSIFSK